MNADNPDFYLFATTRAGNWYRCKICGYNERYIPQKCPICGGKRPEHDPERDRKLDVKDLID